MTVVQLVVNERGYPRQLSEVNYEADAVEGALESYLYAVGMAVEAATLVAVW